LPEDCVHMSNPSTNCGPEGGGGGGGAHARFNALLAWAHRVQAFFAEPRQFYDTAVRLERPAWRVVQFPDGMAKLCSWGHAGCCFYAHVTWNYERVIEDVRALHKKGAGATEHVSAGVEPPANNQTRIAHKKQRQSRNPGRPAFFSRAAAAQK
jgi:hypothetical protein